MGQSSVQVTSSQTKGNVDVTNNMAQYWAEKSKEWAISENTVSGEDNSSKWYANKSKQYKENAEAATDGFNSTVENATNEFNTMVNGAKSNIGDLTLEFNNIYAEKSGALQSEYTGYSNSLEDKKNTAIASVDAIRAETLTEIATAKNITVSDIQTEAQEQIANIESMGFWMEDGKFYYTDENGNKQEFKSGSGGHNLFDIIISDHILEGEEATGKALQGTYTLTADTDFYNKCVEEKEAATESTITVGDYSFTGYTNANGHIFYDIAEKPAVDSVYEATGKAFYYGIDTENQRIFLPRLKNVTLGMGDLTDTIRAKGSGITLGWEDKDGNHYGTIAHPGAAGGGFGTISAGDNYGKSLTENGNLSGNATPYTAYGISSNSSKSGIVVDGQTIEDVLQPAYLYFCVGNTFVNTANIDAEKLTGDIRNLETLVNEKTTPAEAANAASPSDSFIDLTVGATNAVYTVPAAGIVWFQRRQLENDKPIEIVVLNSDNSVLYRMNMFSTGASNTLKVWAEISKNQNFRIVYSGNGDNAQLRFIYKNGTESEAN